MQEFSCNRRIIWLARQGAKPGYGNKPHKKEKVLPSILEMQVVVLNQKYQGYEDQARMELEKLSEAADERAAELGAKSTTLTNTFAGFQERNHDLI